jgi:hypothetical protein
VRPDPGTLRTAAVAALLVVIALIARRSLEAPSVAPERAAELLALHEALFEDVPRPTGSDAAARARARIAEALAAAGCPPQTQTAWSCGRRTCAWITNLWCRLDGRAGPAVVGMAHTDSVPAGPGAADDGAGVVAWVDAVRVLARDDLARPFVLVLTDGEELGLLGARAFFADPPFDDPIGEVVNLEARGTGGASLLFEAVGPERPWGRWYAASGARPNGSSLYPAVYERLPNDTDLSVVRSEGLAGVNHAFVGHLPRYHTPLDDRAHLDPRSLAQHADVALRWVRALQRPAPGPPVTYTDLLGLVLLRWPTWAGPVGAIACLLGWAAWLGVDLRAGRVRARDVAAATGAVLALIVGATILAEALGAAVSAAAGPSWWGRPWPLRGATWCATVACALGLGRLGDAVSRWHAALGLAAVGVAAAVALEPRLAVLGLQAVAFALLWRTAWARRPDLGLLGLGPALAAAWFPLAFGLEDALTLQHPAVVAVPLALAVLGAVPALARPGRAIAALWVVAAGLAAVGAAGPAFTAERPQPTSVVVTQRGDAVDVDVRAFVGEVPAAPRGVGPLDLRPPEVEWVTAQVARLVPARGGTTLEVVADVPFRIDGAAWFDGRGWLVGVGVEGVEVRFASPPGSLVVAEETSGLPAAIARSTLFEGPAVPAHRGDRTRVEVRVR